MSLALLISLMVLAVLTAYAIDSFTSGPPLA